jgi:hypothetical protein
MMTLLTISNEFDEDHYLERTAERLRSMVARTPDLHEADPVVVRTRYEHMDRHVRWLAKSGGTAA